MEQAYGFSPGSLVLGNGALLGESPWAHGAGVGLLTGVRLLVPGNVTFLAGVGLACKDRLNCRSDFRRGKANHHGGLFA